MISEFIQSIMNFWRLYRCVESVISKVSPTESFSEGIVAGEVFVCQFKLCRLAGSVIHIVRSVDLWTDLQAMLGIFEQLRILNWKFGSLHKLLVLINETYAFALEPLFDDFALDQTFGFFEVVHRLTNLRVGWDFGSLNIHFLSPDAVLYPRRAVFTVDCLVQSSFPNSRKITVLSIIHKNGKIITKCKNPFYRFSIPKKYFLPIIYFYFILNLSTKKIFKPQETCKLYQNWVLT